MPRPRSEVPVDLDGELSYFADSTMALLAKLEPVMTRRSAVHVRDFIDPDSAEETALRESLERGFAVVHAMALYSIELVTIAESDEEAAEQIEAYVGHMRPLAEQLCVACELEEGRFDARLDKAAEADSFLGAIRAAQPILNTAVREALILADRTEAELRALADRVDAAVDDEYADLLRYQEELVAERAAALRSLECVHRARRGEAGALAELRALGTVHEPGLVPEDVASPRELTALSDHLVERLDKLARIRTAIEPDAADYRSAHMEADELFDEALESINRYRVSLVVWMRAHQKMASGVVQPAEWFDLNDAPAFLIRAGTRVL